MRKWLLAGAGLGLAFLSGFAGYLVQQAMTGEALPVSADQLPLLPAVHDVLGLQHPPFTLPDLDGRAHTIDEWQGQVILLNFWATWCLPCREEIPVLVDLQKRFVDHGLQIIGIALQQASEVRDFADELDINYPVLVGELEVARITVDYGNSLGALPYTAIIDRAGRIAFVKRGPLTRTEAESVINTLL